MVVDMKKFVLVNRQPTPVSVYDRNKRQVRVAPISLITPYQPWDRSATYVLTDPYFASNVSPQGPLYTMDRKEAEKLMGDSFPVDGVAPDPTADTTATPMGESVTSAAAKARPHPAAPVAPVVVNQDPAPDKLRQYQDLRDDGMSDDEARAAVWPTDAEVATPDAPASEDSGASGGDDEDVSLLTDAELEALPFEALREYGTNWNLKGASRKTLMDKLHKGEFVAPAGVE